MLLHVNKRIIIPNVIFLEFPYTAHEPTLHFGMNVKFMINTHVSLNISAYEEILLSKYFVPKLLK